MDTSQIFLLFLLLAFASAANILRNEEAVVCDPAEDPSSCPTNRRCEDEDGDGEYNCVCDKRFYTTHTLGHCVLGFKELVYDMEKELAVLEEKQEHDNNWLNETLSELLEMPTTTVTTTTTVFWGRSSFFILVNGQKEGQPNDGSFPATAEVADFGNPTHTCQKLADFPQTGDWFPRGGWVDGVLIICSIKSDKKCYKLSEDGSAWTELSDTMSDSRRQGDGVVIRGQNGDPDKLWMFGPNQNSDFVYSNGTIEPGPTPPDGRRHPCMVYLETGNVLIVGGADSKDKKKVTLYNPTKGEFKTQAPMNQERDRFACTSFKSAKHGGREVVYVGGGYDNPRTAELLDYTQTEVWELVDNEMKHSGNYGPRAIATEDGTGVYHYYTSKVEELTCTTTSCTFSDPFELTTQENNRRSHGNIIPIPASLASCTA